MLNLCDSNGLNETWFIEKARWEELLSARTANLLSVFFIGIVTSFCVCLLHFLYGSQLSNK